MPLGGDEDAPRQGQRTSIFVGGTKVPWWRLYAQLNGTRFRRIATRPWGGPVRTEENYRRSVPH
jgi:hypothetical protein